MATTRRAGAAALILGSAAYILIMALHPTSHGGPVVGHLSLSGLVHGFALVVAPTVTFGFLALSQRLGLDRPAVALALIFYGFGAVAILAAATMSGFVAPQVYEAAHAAAGPDRLAVAELGRVSFWLNQAFAQVAVAQMSIAIILWSLAWPARSRGGWAIRIWGLLVGLGVLAWQVSGALSLDVHGMGAVVLAQASWTIAVAVVMLRGRAEPPAS